MFKKLKKWALSLKHRLYALYLAYHRKDIPLMAKIVAIITVGYALSPIDLIPDFIPVIGYLDDMILLPLGIALAVRLIPKSIWNECKAEAQDATLKSLPHSKIAAVIVVIIWIFMIIMMLNIFK